MSLAVAPYRPRRSSQASRPCNRVKKRRRPGRRSWDIFGRKRTNRVQPSFTPDEYWLLLQARKIHRYSLPQWAYHFLLADAQLKLGLITAEQFVEIMRPRAKGSIPVPAAPLDDYQI